MPDRIVGFYPYRLIEGDECYQDEVIMNKAFNNMMERHPMFWNFMTGTNNHGTKPRDCLTDRELAIVATTIQWLGTPVGKAFLEETGIWQRKS